MATAALEAQASTNQKPLPDEPGVETTSWTDKVFFEMKHFGKPKAVDILRSYGEAWNAGDVDAIVDHFSDKGFLYTDAFVPEGIRNKADLRRHVRNYFKAYPKQNWTTSVQLFANALRGDEWAVYYHFKLYRSATDAKPAVDGTGMERYTLDEDGKLTRNEVQMNFNQLDISAQLGIPNFRDDKPGN